MMKETLFTSSVPGRYDFASGLSINTYKCIGEPMDWPGFGAAPRRADMQMKK
jgi:hypothetical protein